MVKVGRDLWRPPGPNSAQAEHPEQAAQDHIQRAFEDLQGGRINGRIPKQQPHTWWVILDLQKTNLLVVSAVPLQHPALSGSEEQPLSAAAGHGGGR